MDSTSNSGGIASHAVDLMTNGHLTEAEMAYEMCQLIGARACYEVVKDSLKIKNMVHKPKKSYADLLSLPKKMYLESTLVPALMNGLAFVARDRPISPITTLAVYLMKNSCPYDTEVDAETEGKPQASKIKNKLGALYSKVFAGAMENLEKSVTMEEDIRELDRCNNEHLDAVEIAYRTCTLASIIHGSLNLSHSAKVPKKETYSDLLSLPKKSYLEHTMVPVLANGLAVMARDRPVRPVTALALFLLKNGNLYETEVERRFEMKIEQCGKETKND